MKCLKEKKNTSQHFTSFPFFVFLDKDTKFLTCSFSFEREKRGNMETMLKSKIDKCGMEPENNFLGEEKRWAVRV